MVCLNNVDLQVTSVNLLMYIPLTIDDRINLVQIEVILLVRNSFSDTTESRQEEETVACFTNTNIFQKRQNQT